METFEGKKIKTYVVTLIEEDLTLIGKAGWIYSARGKSLDGGEEIEVLLRMKEPAPEEKKND